MKKPLPMVELTQARSAGLHTVGEVATGLLRPLRRN